MATTRTEFKKLTHSKRRTVARLIKAGEWQLAGYLMGYVLECALKASSCKHLRLSDYPPVKVDEKGRTKVLSDFKTHEFSHLLVVSGLSDLFGKPSPTRMYDNWSQFTTTYSGNWTAVRYDDAKWNNFDETLVTDLYGNLYDDKESILRTIIGKRRW